VVRVATPVVLGTIDPAAASTGAAGTVGSSTIGEVGPATEGAAVFAVPCRSPPLGPLAATSDDGGGVAVSAAGAAGGVTGLPNSSTNTVRWTVSVTTIGVGSVADWAAGVGAAVDGACPCAASSPTVPRKPEVARPVVMTLAADAGCRRRERWAMRWACVAPRASFTVRRRASAAQPKRQSRRARRGSHERRPPARL